MIAQRYAATAWVLADLTCDRFSYLHRSTPPMGNLLIKKSSSRSHTRAFFLDYRHSSRLPFRISTSVLHSVTNTLFRGRCCNLILLYRRRPLDHSVRRFNPHNLACSILHIHLRINAAAHGWCSLSTFIL